MLSERLFARSYGSFWRDLLPFSENFVRGVNDRWGKPPEESFGADSITMAVVNEGAVQLYRRIVAGEGSLERDTAQSLRDAGRFLGLSDFGLPEWCIANTVDMARAMVRYYGTDDLEFAPEFSGCGFLSACKGDIKQGAKLIEIKAGHRSFRSSDFRQILTYLALDYADPRHGIEHVSLYNPRLNRAVELSVNELCIQMGGASTTEIFSTMIEFLASVTVSDA